MNRKQITKIITILFVMVFIVTTMIFACYVSKEINHHCLEDECPTCICIHNAEQNLINIYCLSGLQSAAMWLCCIVVITLLKQISGFIKHTLVDEKIRMNN